MKAKDYLESVAEEISLTTGLKTNVGDENIKVDTIAGCIYFKPLYFVLIEDVYRFIYIYGIKLTNYGINERIKALRDRSIK